MKSEMVLSKSRNLILIAVIFSATAGLVACKKNDKSKASASDRGTMTGAKVAPHNTQMGSVCEMVSTTILTAKGDCAKMGTGLEQLLKQHAKPIAAFTKHTVELKDEKYEWAEGECSKHLGKARKKLFACKGNAKINAALKAFSALH